MLPDILKVAEENGIEFDPKTFGKRETRCKCPFCMEDSNKKGKYYLSLNTEHQLYKCWFCKASGGVLDFESKVSNTPYDEVVAKYFGENRKPVHPAERLTFKQLERIGWKEFRDKKTVRYRDAVLRDWQRYESKVLSELFAELVIISKLPVERRNALIEYFKKRCMNSEIRDCYHRIIEEYKKPTVLKSEWAKDGLAIARVSWRLCRLNNGNFYTNVLVQVPFVHYLYVMEKDLGKSKQNVV